VGRLTAVDSRVHTLTDWLHFTVSVTAAAAAASSLLVCFLSIAASAAARQPAIQY